MRDLLGIIAPLRKLLSNTDESIQVEVDVGRKDALKLKKDRVYVIPDFQREIRWDEDNLSQLVDDIKSGPKYLGNIILTEVVNDNKFLIIDGQQRITVLIMILACIKLIHGKSIDVIDPCQLKIESFTGLTEIMEKQFPPRDELNTKIIESDYLNQINKYYELWEKINETSCIINRDEVGSFIENLSKSEINIILNKSDDVKDGIRYFIDVNLKGKQLDVEDIFKGYLFRNDSSTEIRSEWYQLKKNVAKIEETKKMKYPLLKLLEHYFLCDLYNNSKYKGAVFEETFLLKSELRFQQSPEKEIKYRAQTHIIEVIQDNNYMLSSIKKLNEIIIIMLNIVTNESINGQFTALFSGCLEKGKKVKLDNAELKIIHNFICKILKDDKIIPKALVMKYILTILLDKNEKEKKEYKKIYGVYLLAVLFVIFENKKSKDVFMSVLKASYTEWYEESIKTINAYFSPDKITANKILAQFKRGTNEDEEDYRFRCKSIATIYNFFKIKEGKVVLVGGMDKVKKFISNDDEFSTEHFIISDSKSREMKVVCDSTIIKYSHPKDFFNKYVNSLFNFIFINKSLNDTLANNWLPHKMKLIDNIQIECDYSKMVLKQLKNISAQMEQKVHDAGELQDNLDLYFSRDFKDQYIAYSRSILNDVIEKIKK